MELGSSPVTAPGASVAPGTGWSGIARRGIRSWEALSRAVPAVALGLALAAATGLAAVPWLRALQVPGTLLCLLLAAAASVAISAAATRAARLPPVASYALSLIGLVVLVGAMAGANPHDVWYGLTRVPARVLSETLPLVGARRLVIGPVVVTWLCGAAAAELLWRHPRTPAGLVFPVAAFVGAFAATEAAPGTEIAVGAGLFAALAVAALAAHAVSEQERHTVAVASGDAVLPRRKGNDWWMFLVAVAALGTVLGLLAPSFPTAQKASNLSRVAEPRTGQLVNPVAAMASLREADPTAAPVRELSVETSRVSTGYLGIAILDDYDGGSWSFDTTFQPTGGRIPAAPAGGPVAATEAPVEQQYQLANHYAVQFIPSMDRPTNVTGLAVDADATTGMVVPASSTSGGASYKVTSEAPTATLATVPRADGIGVAAGATGPRQSDLALPSGSSTDIATALRYLATATKQRPAATVAFLQSALDVFRTQGRRATFSGKTTQAPASQGGTSLAEVINAVAVSRIATPEQYATMFVMVARYLGVPARLVTGFRVPTGVTSPTQDGLVLAGTHQVTNRDAWTWAEIPIAGVGWVVADPTPVQTAAQAAAPPPPAQPTGTTLPPPRANAVPVNGSGAGHAVAPRVNLQLPARGAGASWGLIAILAAVGVILLIGAVPGVAALRRARRRRARRAVDPAQLAVGAWLELLDGLDRAGLSPGPASTSAEVVTEAGRSFGPQLVPAVARVGSVADQAMFSVHEPPAPATAQSAWEDAHAATRHAIRSLDRRQRLRATLRVGSNPTRPDSRPRSRAGDVRQ